MSIIKYILSDKKKDKKKTPDTRTKSKPFRSKNTKLKYRDLEPGGSANNPAPQQAKPTRMPKQKNMQGPKNPKGMGFSGGGKVTHQDYRKKGMFK